MDIQFFVVYLQSDTNIEEMKRDIKTVEQISLRGSYMEMEAGDVLSVPFGVRAYSYVRHLAVAVGIETGRRYTVHVNRDEGAYEVTRIS